MLTPDSTIESLANALKPWQIDWEPRTEAERLSGPVVERRRGRIGL